MRVVVLGATSDLGQRVVTQLCDLGHTTVATSRSPERIRLVDPRAETAITSGADTSSLAQLLAGADRIVNIAHASTIDRLIPLVPPTCQRLIAVGSTRRYSAVPDRGADDVRRGEATFLRSNLPGSVLHPAMIYGGKGEQNITRILTLIERWPRWLPLVWPVPDGGKALVQPVHINDVVSAIVAAVTVEASVPQIIVVAGPQPIPLAQMLRTCATACGRRLRILPVSTNALIAVVRFLSVVSRRLPFSVAELQRSREDKSFDIEALRLQLGIEPRSFADGVRLLCIRKQDKTNLGCAGQLTGG